MTSTEQQRVESFKEGDRVQYFGAKSKTAHWSGIVTNVEQRAGFSIVWVRPSGRRDAIGCQPENLRIFQEQAS